MIISVSSLKGGVGKSTIAQNLAVCFAHVGYSVCIIDSDVNQSTFDWSVSRPDTLPYIQVVGIEDGRKLYKNASGLNEKFDFVIIDGTPSLDAITSTIIIVADLVVIPVKAGSMELKVTQKFLGRYYDAVDRKGSDIPACLLLSARKTGTNLSKETQEVLEEAEIRSLKSSLGDRIAFSKANEYGLGIIEYNKDKLAKQEMVEVFREIRKIIDTL